MKASQTLSAAILATALVALPYAASAALSSRATMDGCDGVYSATIQNQSTKSVRRWKGWRCFYGMGGATSLLHLRGAACRSASLH